VIGCQTNGPRAMPLPLGFSRKILVSCKIELYFAGPRT
jgi:hypothetical protein